MVLALTRPPVAPSTLRPETFAEEMDDRLAWQDINVNEMNQVLPLVEGAASAGTSAAASAAAAALSAASALAAPGTNATSTTPLTVGAGVQAIVIQANKDFAPGAWLMCARTADPDGVWMLGQLRSYTKATGALSLVVATGDTKGAGTFNDWTLSLSSARSTVFNAVDLALVGPSIRPSLLADFANTKRLDPRFVYTMASPLCYYDATGILRTSSAGVPAFNHDPATGRCLGLWMWPASTNVNRNSTMQGGGVGVLPNYWSLSSTASGITPTVLGIGGDNGIEYIDVAFTGTASAAVNFFLSFDSPTQQAAASGQSWTGSANVKKVSGNTPSTCLMAVSGRLSNGSPNELATVVLAPSAAALCTQRPSVTLTMSSGLTAYVLQYVQCGFNSGEVANFVLRIGLPQLEQLTSATPAIKTTNAAVARAVPMLTVATSAFEFNALEGSIYVEGDYGTTGPNPTLARLDDGSEANRIMLRVSSGTQRLQSVTAGTNDVDIVLTAPAVGVPTRVVGAYKANDFAATKDGGAVVADTSGAVPTVTTLRIGQDASGSNSVSGHISKFAYYPRRLTNAELVALSTL